MLRPIAAPVKTFLLELGAGFEPDFGVLRASPKARPSRPAPSISRFPGTVARWGSGRWLVLRMQRERVVWPGSYVTSPSVIRLSHRFPFAALH